MGLVLRPIIVNCAQGKAKHNFTLVNCTRVLIKCKNVIRIQLGPIYNQV